MKKAVIFDMDGLLIDSEIISYQLYCDFLGEYGYSFSKEEFARELSGRIASENVKTVVNHYQLPLSSEEALALILAMEKEYLKKGVPLKAGAKQLLSYLKEHHYKILLASSSQKDRAVSILDQNEVTCFFDDMVFGLEVKRGKPYPDIFLKAQEKSGEAPENCLILEDSEAGIQAAHSAGIDVICIPDMKVPADEFKRMAICELPSLSDVISWLESSG